MSMLPRLRPLDDMIRVNKDGSITVGIIPETAPKEAEAPKVSAPAEEKPVKKTARKTVKK